MYKFWIRETVSYSAYKLFAYILTLKYVLRVTSGTSRGNCSSDHLQPLLHSYNLLEELLALETEPPPRKATKELGCLYYILH